MMSALAMKASKGEVKRAADEKRIVKERRTTSSGVHLALRLDERHNVHMARWKPIILAAWGFAIVSLKARFLGRKIGA